MTSKVIVIEGKDPFKIINGLEFFKKPRERKIIIKPNLIIDKPPPTTTPCEIVEVLTKYYIENNYEVIIAEGSGWIDTFQAYKKLGYFKISEKYGVRLIDLNNDNFEILEIPNALFLKKFEIPLTLKNSFIISVPILKEHSITGVTLSLKNMLGATLGEKATIAKKGRFHKKLNESIIDINLYLKPKLAIIDGRIAGIGGELGAIPKELNVIILSNDLVAADAVGASYLGKNPLDIKHIKLAQEIGLGIADLNKIEIVKIK
ncbi:MAG: DUF362 domain-containing protein [Nitrososphaerota archaeon]